MKVTITDTVQRKFVVEVDAAASVADLKDALAAQHQIGSRESMRFIQNAKILSNDDPLAACNIHDGDSSIVLSLNKKAASTIAALPPPFQAAFSRLPKDIRMPLPDEEVHNDECLFSFDNPESPHGIFLPLTPSGTRQNATFYAYGTRPALAESAHALVRLHVL
jgi:hypothetical protein